MTQSLRQSTLQTLGLGTVMEIFHRGELPVRTADLVDQVFGPAADRGALLISGANGIVGAGKAIQLGSRLEPYGVPIVALDFPGAPDGIGKQYPGLMNAFGKDRAAKIMSGVTRFTYDGTSLPPQIKAFRPRFALEAIPELLDLKRAHYEILRAAYEGIEIRSVTSGFPNSELGVGIAHPAFPHEINKIWEIVEPTPSAITQLLWALGLIPVPVSDHWSFVLDVLFCGVTQAALRFHEATNCPFWKIDKYVRKLLGPNPFRAHDAIGAAGANFLTWSCLHHLGQHYGALFAPSPGLEERKDNGQDWYPLNHFRPVVNWSLDDEELEELRAWVFGALFQMISLMLHEKRALLAHINAIGELCAQFVPGILATIRRHGPDAAIKIVEAYHRLHPEAAKAAWYPEVFAQIETPEWQQLYVNAEHDGTVGVITLSRESYSNEVDAELNRAIDWLRAADVERVILTGDFHLSTQMIGADTNDFYPAMEDAAEGVAVAARWSATARRLHAEFATSVGLVHGKRCLGGMLELMVHCHYLVAVEDAALGMPEVTLPVVPGMEGCHWPFRKTGSDAWPKLLALLLDGKPVRAREAVGWLVDHAGPIDDAIAVAFKMASGGDHGVARRTVNDKALTGVTDKMPDLTAAGSPVTEVARRAILENVRNACGVPLAEAITLQAKHSGGFMGTPECRGGTIGTIYQKTMIV